MRGSPMLFVDVQSLNQRRLDPGTTGWQGSGKTQKRWKTSQKAPHPVLLPKGEKGP
jgi:hypothetical protein